MGKLKTALQKIVGGITKVSKSEYFMVVTAMFLPIGIVFLFQGDKFLIFGQILLGFATFSWLMALWQIHREEKQEAEEKQKFYDLLWDIRDELKGIRQDRNEHKNSNRE
ncbi:MAG: hypothetical protein HY578_08800 [Nitrospinae bacterium]|nr:hypothetical protein [Nitrospinota bacterium]